MPTWRDIEQLATFRAHQRLFASAGESRAAGGAALRPRRRAYAARTWRGS